MDDIRQYLLTIICAAILCAVVLRIFDKNSVNNSVLKLLTGIFLSITVISPLTDIKIQDITYELTGFSNDAELFVAQSSRDVNSQLCGIITQETEAYILDKARSLGVAMEAEIVLSDDEYKPQSVIIRADISPYAKFKMQQIIAEDLGIPKEMQIWK